MFTNLFLFFCAAFFFRFYSLFVFNYENLVDRSLPQDADYDFIIGECLKHSAFNPNQLDVSHKSVLAQPAQLLLRDFLAKCW